MPERERTFQMVCCAGSLSAASAPSRSMARLSSSSKMKPGAAEAGGNEKSWRARGRDQQARRSRTTTGLRAHQMHPQPQQQPQPSRLHACTHARMQAHEPFAVAGSGTTEPVIWRPRNRASYRSPLAAGNEKQCDTEPAAGQNDSTGEQMSKSIKPIRQAGPHQRRVHSSSRVTVH